MNDLDARLLAAHAAGDKPGLVVLYTQAADMAPTEDAEGFYLTQAYVFALDCGDNAASGLHARLLEMGRDVPDSGQIPG